MMLAREIRALDFCWTDAEIARTGATQYSGVERGAILVYLTPQSAPVALRVQEAREVYIKTSRYQEMGPTDRALLVIHEALHSFMPQRLSAKTYYENLYSIVRTISELNGSSVSEMRSFEVAIRKSGLRVPTSSQVFD